MRGYVLRRIVQAMICLIAITIIIFMLTRLSGDPAMLMAPPSATEKDIENLRRLLGLDKPLYVQYYRYIASIIKGEFGQSLRWDVPTIVLFLERLPNTVILGTSAMALAVFFGIPIGIISAVKVGRWFDNFGKVIALFGQALPVFWLGIMLMFIFAVKLRLLPSSGIGSWRHLVLPSITLALYFTASLMRLSRSAMLDVLDTEYIKMARIKGLPEYLVVMRHAFKNALIPIVTLGAINLVIILNGTVITETVFNYPGVGKLIVDGIKSRDYPVVQTCVLFASSLFIFANLFVDILYRYLDPRIRYR